MTDAAFLSGSDRYRAVAARRLVLIAGLAVALLLSVCLDMALGPANYLLGEVVRTILSPNMADLQARVVIWDIRMPIALMAVVTGAALSISGAQMQTILGNPLASPFTLGISGAASFGAALALSMGIAVLPFAIGYAVAFNAFVMAIASALFINYAASRRGASVETIVLLGIALVFAFNAALGLLQYLASEQALGAIVFWTMGSLTKATWPKVAGIALVIAFVLPFMLRQAWALTAMRLGGEKAASLGVNVAGLRLRMMILVALLSSVPIAFVGTIGFVGLVGPHIARMLVGEDQRFLLPASALTGALMLSAASVASKTIVPGAVLPVGIITALVGVPFFFVLIFRNRGRSW